MNISPLRLHMTGGMTARPIPHSANPRGCGERRSYRGFAALGGEAGAKEAGKMHLEGKEYTAQDGDIMHFRFAN